MNFIFKDNSSIFKDEMQAAVQRALIQCGMTGEKYAKLLCPVDTDNLRGSITYAINGKDVYIGTNSEYAVYVEFGTGKYYPGGRQDPWAYQDAKGKWHRTGGSKAQPFIKSL